MNFYSFSTTRSKFFNVHEAGFFTVGDSTLIDDDDDDDDVEVMMMMMIMMMMLR